MGLCVFLALLEALQILFVAGAVSSHIPTHWTVPIPKGLEPERDSELYLLFLSSSVIVFIGCLRWLYPRLGDLFLAKQLRQFLIAEAVWACLMFFCFFQWVTYQYPFYNVLPYQTFGWIEPLFWAIVALSVASKVFWMEIVKGIDGYANQVCVLSGRCAKSWWGNIAAWGVLTGLLLPKGDDVVALGYFWGSYRGWNGCVYAQWLLAKGFDFAHLPFILAVSLITLFFLLFLVFKEICGDFFLSLAAVFLALKVNLFHPGLAPVFLLFPNGTILGHAFEFMVIALALTGMHRRVRHGGKYLLLAALGAMVYWIHTHQPLINGLSNVPMYAPLRMRQFFPFFAGFVFPVFFLAGLVWSGYQRWHRSVKTIDNERLLIICCWGLWLYVEFVLVPMAYAYGMVAIAAIMGAMVMLNTLQRHGTYRVIGIVFFVLALALLFTNRLFLTYPHWNTDKGRYQKERSIQEQLLKKGFASYEDQKKQ